MMERWKNLLSLYFAQNQPAQIPGAVAVGVSVDAAFCFVETVRTVREDL
jgi:hypothetical protein